MMRKPKGFTLIEIVAVLLLIAVMYSLAVTFFTGGAARIRSASGQLLADLQATYLRSIQKSKIHRIRFSEDLSNYSIEEFQAPMEKPKDEEDKEAMEKWEDYKKRLDEMNPADRAKLTRMDRGTFLELKKKSLPTNISIKHFYTTRTPSSERDPKVIYFFPSGSADQSAVVLTDGQSQFATLKLNPITGRVMASNDELTEDQWKKLTEPPQD